MSLQPRFEQTMLSLIALDAAYSIYPIFDGVLSRGGRFWE
jgi:hypothetical protein